MHIYDKIYREPMEVGLENITAEIFFCECAIVCVCFFFLPNFFLALRIHRNR